MIKIILLSLSIRFSGTDRETWSLNFATLSTICSVQSSCYAYVPTFTSTTWDVTKSPTPYPRNTRNFTVEVEAVLPCESFSTMKRATLSYLQPLCCRRQGRVCLCRPSDRTNSVLNVNICVFCSTSDAYADVLHPECCIFLHC